jgi:hypothetical protein
MPVTDLTTQSILCLSFLTSKIKKLVQIVAKVSWFVTLELRSGGVGSYGMFLGNRSEMIRTVGEVN